MLEPVARVPGAQSRDGAVLIFAYAAAGRWADAERLRDERARTTTGRPANWAAAVTALAFDDRAAALAALERGLEEGARDMMRGAEFVNCAPTFQRLATEPRFVALMARHGLPICPATTPWPIRPRPGAAAP